jgi:hypothetical protein
MLLIGAHCQHEPPFAVNGLDDGTVARLVFLAEEGAMMRQ